MVKHTQTICRQFADELFDYVWPFCGIGAWRVKNEFKNSADFFNADRNAINFGYIDILFFDFKWR